MINENCPACFEAPKERQRVKLMLASQEHIHNELFSSMLNAMKPLMMKENNAYVPKDAEPRDGEEAAEENSQM